MRFGYGPVGAATTVFAVAEFLHLFAAAGHSYCIPIGFALTVSGDRQEAVAVVYLAGDYSWH